MPDLQTDPHREQSVETGGAPLAEARVVAILVHGRGGSAEDMFRLARVLDQRGMSWLAPQAADGAWYPQRFLAPLEANEPHLASALAVVHGLLDRVLAAGLAQDRIVLGGFSQGACLALEAALRRGGRFGGVFALSGAVIGPPGAIRPHDRGLAGTPVLIGCAANDAHIPFSSVEESASVLLAAGADVSAQIHPGSAHMIFPEDIERVRALIATVAGD